MCAEDIINTTVCSASPKALQFLGLSIQKGHGNEKVGKKIQSNPLLKLDFVLEQRGYESRKKMPSSDVGQWEFPSSFPPLPAV